MDFSEKLNNLMTLAGITNSKLAKGLKIDPSLVSRWRHGLRRPVSNSDMLVQVASQIAGSLSTSYHKVLLSKLIGDTSAIHMDTEALAETIFIWLSDNPSWAGSTYEEVPAAAPRRAVSLSEFAASNAFAGPEGRHLVLKQLFDHFDSSSQNETILFYSSDPVAWIREDIRFRNSIIEKKPDLFDSISHVKLILHNNASVDEIVYSLEYVIPFIRRGSIQIAQIPRYRKELFSNTILIAGKMAAASHGFAGSSNFMTNLYSDPTFVKELSDDFNRLFASCEPVHTTEHGITLLDAITEADQLSFLDRPIVFIGNMYPSITVPVDGLQNVLRMSGQRLADEPADKSMFREFIRHYEEFMQTQTCHLLLPLYMPEDVKNGAVTISCLPHFYRGRPLVDVHSYLAILRNILDLCEKHPRLILRTIRELSHEHAILLQKDTSVAVIQNNKPFTFYKSSLPGLTEAFLIYLENKYGSLEQQIRERATHIEKLKKHIALFESCLKQA